MTAKFNTLFTWIISISISPEIVQNKPYGEKADIWSAGCLLYQMAMLQPPFYTTNLLQLAKKVRNSQLLALIAHLRYISISSLVWIYFNDIAYIYNTLQIVEADFSPIPEEDYSPLLRETIDK